MPRASLRWAAAVALILLVISACSHGNGKHAATPSGPDVVPHYDHVVVVMEENHGYDQIIGNGDAPYLNRLADGGVNFTDASAEHHPSQPNYLEFFSGSNQGVTDDHCITDRLGDPSLGGQLLDAGKTFTAYADGLPGTGASDCHSGDYARYHNVPMAFSDVPTSHVVPFSQFPQGDYGSLPSVAWVTPDLQHDMHDGSVADGDTWLHDNLSGYADWAMTHNSLLIVAFDEDGSDDSGGGGDSGTNHIPAILFGAHLRTGDSGAQVNHLTLLAILEDSFGLPHLGGADGKAIPPVFGNAHGADSEAGGQPAQAPASPTR